jgi:hypothetical protein
MDTPYTPLLRTQLEVEQFWRRLMQPLGWLHASLWFAVVGPDDRPIPVMNEIDDLPDLALGRVADEVAERLARLLRDHDVGCRLVLLYSRPGRGRPSRHDRDCLRALNAGMRRHGVPGDAGHIATDTGIYPMTGDDVLAA